MDFSEKRAMLILVFVLAFVPIIVFGSSLVKDRTNVARNTSNTLFAANSTDIDGTTGSFNAESGVGQDNEVGNDVSQDEMNKVDEGTNNTSGGTTTDDAGLLSQNEYKEYSHEGDNFIYSLRTGARKVTVESNFDFDAATGTIIKYSGTDKNVVIPKTIGNVTVKSIGANAFSGASITSLVIPNTVTDIGASAFDGNAISKVILPNSISSIGTSSFRNNVLSSLTLSTSLTKISSNAFAGNDLQTVSIPSSVTEIASSAFANANIETLTLGGGIATIGEKAFYGNSLISLSIPDSCKTIGVSAFAGNTLTKVNFGTAVETISANAFKNNIIESISFPSSLKTIGANAFENNAIASVAIPSQVTQISNYAFHNNEISSLSLNNVTSVGDYAFQSNKLTSVSIDNLTSIGAYAFDSNKIESVNITSRLSSVGNYAFADNNLTSIDLTDYSLSSIPDGLFSNNSLTAVDVPSNITSIGEKSFYSNNIQKGMLTIPSTISAIGTDAFVNNKIGYVVVTDVVIDDDTLAPSFDGGTQFVRGAPSVSEKVPSDIYVESASDLVKAHGYVMPSEEDNYETATGGIVVAETAMDISTNSAFVLPVIEGDNITEETWYYRANSSSEWKQYDPEDDTIDITVSNLEYDGYQFYCVVSNPVGSIKSDIITLHEVRLPTLESNENKVVLNGDSYTMSAKLSATGHPDSYIYQWYKDGVAISGANSASYTIDKAIKGVSGGTYKCTVTNDAGTVSTNDIKITVVISPAAVVSSPDSTTVYDDATATFKAKGSGDDLSFVWQYSDDGGTTWNSFTEGSVSSTSTETTLTITGAKILSKYNQSKFRVAISGGGADYIYSDSAFLYVLRSNSIVSFTSSGYSFDNWNLEYYRDTFSNMSYSANDNGVGETIFDFTGVSGWEQAYYRLNTVAGSKYTITMQIKTSNAINASSDGNFELKAMKSIVSGNNNSSDQVIAHSVIAYASNNTPSAYKTITLSFDGTGDDVYLNLNFGYIPDGTQTTFSIRDVNVATTDSDGIITKLAATSLSTDAVYNNTTFTPAIIKEAEQIGADAFGNKYHSTGYTLVGWKRNDNYSNLLNGTLLSNSDVLNELTNLKGGSDRVYQAYYKRQVKTVTFVNGYDGTTLDTQKVVYGDAATTPAAPTRRGYTFAGWDIDYSNVTSDLTVTAQWNINYYTVTYANGYDGGVISTQSIAFEHDASAPSNPSRTGYTFTGWSGTQTSIDSDRTITANWTINYYTVYFNASGHGGSGDNSRTVAYGEYVNAGWYGASKGYYDFIGWDSNSEGHGAWGGFNMPAYNFTLYAQFHTTVWLNFNTNMDSDTGNFTWSWDVWNSQTGVDIGLPSVSPVGTDVSGYGGSAGHFERWSTNDNDTGSQWGGGAGFNVNIWNRGTTLYASYTGKSAQETRRLYNRYGDTGTEASEYAIQNRWYTVARGFQRTNGDYSILMRLDTGSVVWTNSKKNATVAQDESSKYIPRRKLTNY